MGKKSTKTTAKAEPWKPAQGAILDAIGQTQGVVNANQPNLNSIASGIGAQLPGLATKAFGSDPTLGAANGYATDVLGGKYLNSNPFMDQMVGQTTADVRDQVNSMFGKAGASMGTPYASAMTKELANAENSLRYGDYQQERQNQQQTANLAPSLYAGQFAGIPSYLSAAQSAGTLPYAGISALSPIMALAGGSGTQTGTQPGGWGTDLLSAGMMALPFIPGFGKSDRRLKTKIEKLGEASDGLGIYEWNWKSDPDGQRVRGVIADEVEKLRPWAYAKAYFNGYDGVNYAALGSLA